MEDEYIDILTDDLKVLKRCLKSEAHQNGYLHASVHIWLYTDDGKILLQKRSANKIAFPSLWDVSVAGHISSGESEISAAVREVKEEIGLQVTEKELLKIGVFREQYQHQADFIDNEIHHVYICKLTSSINQLSLQKEEVSDIKLISFEKFTELRKQSNFSDTYVPNNSEYCDFVLKKLKDTIDD
jgi:isopentenyl-diphosphate delta-isomerase